MRPCERQISVADRRRAGARAAAARRSEEHTSELQSRENLVCRLLLEKKKNRIFPHPAPRASPAALSVHAFSCAVLHFFFNDTATTEIYTLSLHDALPIFAPALAPQPP